MLTTLSENLDTSHEDEQSSFEEKRAINHVPVILSGVVACTAKHRDDDHDKHPASEQTSL